MNYSDRIKPDDVSINTYLEDLINKHYQIPTFQREVVWQKDNVKKLWDSIFKFYPMGSILIWKTGIKLQNHRKIGGHEINDPDFKRAEYQYILDGQQRTTSLLTSMYGGKIEGRTDFDPSLYIDLTIADVDETDDVSYKKKFLFWDEIDDKNGELKKNTKKRKKYEKGLIVKLQDAKENFEEIESNIVEGEENEFRNYNHPVRKRLRKIRQVLDNYRIPIIELKKIEVAQVCQIFERINQEGRPLNIFDIVVAKTFRPGTNTQKGFYLRELVDQFREDHDGKFIDVDDLTYLQMLAVLINKEFEDSGIKNVTDRYLNEIETEQLEKVWEPAKKAFLETFTFFENHLGIEGPQLVPTRYFYMTFCSYFYKNSDPNYKFLRQNFWYYSFHNDDLLRNTTHMWNHIDKLAKQRNGETPKFQPFIIDRHKLRTASYSSRGRLSRAILSLYANQDPKDWKYPERSVLAKVYYVLTNKPNLHHVFPKNFISKNKGTSQLDGNSLMNIVYLTQITNLNISDKNPIDYIKDFDTPEFEEILGNHLLPKELLEWARMDKMPDNALDIFIETRIDKIIAELRKKIDLSQFKLIDTQGEKTSEELVH